MVRWRDWPAHVQFRTEDFPGAEGAGLLTGRRSGGVYVLDVDYRPAEGVDGFRTLAALEAGPAGPLPRGTLQVRSPSGGLHIYLAAPPDVRYQTQAGKLGPGLDVRAEGGLVVAPGSWHSKRGGYYVIED